MKKLLLFFALLSQWAWAQTPSIVNLKKHISVLASDSLGGRAPGEKGEQWARDYIVKQIVPYGLLPLGDDGYYQKFLFPARLNPHDSLGFGEELNGTNVVAYLDRKSDNTMVLGAHYDHLGEDGRGSSLEANPKGKIHNGADDNASGSAGLIELARLISSQNLLKNYNVLFAWFSAEEAGLIGSKYLSNHFPLKMESVKMMVNLDMIGRLNDSTLALTLMGMGTSPIFGKVLNECNSFNFKLVMDSSGTGPSDHTSFYLKNIPVLAFFTGTHSDYHKPSDDIEKINFQGESEVLSFVLKVLNKCTSLKEIPFTPTKTKANTSAAFKVTMGVMPDYSFSGPGLRIDGVTDGKPAAQGGLKGGDILMKIDHYDIKDIYSYMAILGKFKKGDKPFVTVKRGQEIVVKQIEF
jgi:hypothetical protein